MELDRRLAQLRTEMTIPDEYEQLLSDLRAFCMEAMHPLAAKGVAQSKMEARFWNRTAWNTPHIIWTGMGRDGSDGTPVCDWVDDDGKKIRTTAARVAYRLITHFIVPPDKYLRKNCETSRCISPSCHDVVSERSGRVSAARYDSEGRLLCAAGLHATKNQDPQRQRSNRHCPACYQISQEAIRNEQAALRNAKIFANRARGIPNVPVATYNSSNDDPPASSRFVTLDDISALFEK